MIERLVAGRRALVVGVGNELLGDDGVGPLVAGRLERRHPGRAVDAGAVPENYLGVILEQAPEVVLFVDAADHGGPPGTWCLAPMRDLEMRVGCTHDASLRLLASLLEAEGVRCWLVGVQPAVLGPGRAMSADVLASGRRLARLLSQALTMEAAHA
jgi:hydrogenase 3 maturation protease